MFDFDAVEAKLAALLEGDVKQFAKEHRDETFYGFFVDCSAYYGDVFPAFNTPEALRAQAVRYKTDTESIGGFTTRAELYADKTIADLERMLRWSPGDWKYTHQSLVAGRKSVWRRRWDPVVKAVEAERDLDPKFERRFMEMACRALVRVERSGAFGRLRRTPNFRAKCADHDERKETSQRRLAKVRREFAS